MAEREPVPDPAPDDAAEGLADLSPANFGMVMATGIVSLTAQMLGWSGLARALFGLNVLAYVVLCFLALLRLWRYPRRVLDDLRDHRRGPGFFTTVVATAVLGTQCVLIVDAPRIAEVAAVASFVLWFGFNYSIFTAFMINPRKPTLERGINGAWLLAVVASQSVAVLGALLAAQEPAYRMELNFLALAMWLWGGMHYIWLISLIFYRYNFFALSPAEVLPAYWIDMGAMAIATLAGSLLAVGVADAPLLQRLQPFIQGLTLMYWATGTWWIPMLLILNAWRHGVRRFPLRYGPMYWGAVFPLGMYAASTQHMIGAMGFGFLAEVPRVFFVVALVAWAAAAVGLLRKLWRRARARAAASSRP